MKSYTDLEQSKKLAEFLPLESVDTWWAERYAGRVENYEYIVEEKPVYYLSFTKPSEENYSQDTIKDIPCWSLAALLDVLPNYTIINNGITGVVVWSLDAHSNEHQSLIDACYEVILKLKERNLL